MCTTWWTSSPLSSDATRAAPSGCECKHSCGTTGDGEGASDSRTGPSARSISLVATATMSDGAAGGPEGEEGGGREHDRFLPVANIRRVTGRTGSAELHLRVCVRRPRSHAPRRAHCQQSRMRCARARWTACCDAAPLIRFTWHSRIMKRALPSNAKIAKEAKETVQECVSEFISFITSECVAGRDVPRARALASYSGTRCLAQGERQVPAREAQDHQRGRPAVGHEDPGV